ncbi:uncharacterized protein CCOS01_01792, partial [Colletotrichum costaricense]
LIPSFSSIFSILIRTLTLTLSINKRALAGLLISSTLIIIKRPLKIKLFKTLTIRPGLIRPLALASSFRKFLIYLPVFINYRLTLYILILRTTLILLRTAY